MFFNSFFTHFLGLITVREKLEYIWNMNSFQLLYHAFPGSWSGLEQVLRSPSWQALSRCTSLRFWDDQGSLLSSLEQDQIKTYFFLLCQSPTSINIRTENEKVEFPLAVTALQCFTFLVLQLSETLTVVFESPIFCVTLAFCTATSEIAVYRMFWLYVWICKILLWAGGIDYMGRYLR